MNVEDIRSLHDHMVKSKSELGTLASNILDENLFKNDNVVKVITKETLDESKFSEAINFTRKILKKTENLYHHLGIYCYNLDTLKKFVSDWLIVLRASRIHEGTPPL